MEFADSLPIYLQIADMISDHVLSGKWVEGERMVSVRDLAMQIAVNPNTVMRSFAYLQDIGVIHNKRGIGYFVTEGACGTLLGRKKEEFVEKAVPQFFHTMDLLHIEMSELQRLYAKYSKERQS